MFLVGLLLSGSTARAQVFGPWHLLPGGGQTSSGPEVITWNEETRVFVRGIDDRIYENRLPPGAPIESGWSGWSAVPGDGQTLSEPGVVVFDDALYLFVRGMDNRIYVTSFGGMGWSGWSAVPTEIGHYRGDPLDKELPNAGFTLGTPAAIVFGETGGQTLLLVVQGIDNLIYENFFFPSYPGGHPPPLFFWRGWTDVPGGGQTPSGPEVVITGEASWERPWVFVQGFDNRVYHNTPSPDLGEMLEGIWTGWTEVPGNGQTLSGPGAEGTPTSGHVLAIRGMDNQIYVARVDTGTD